jgi:integrase/recombinase XerD
MIFNKNSYIEKLTEKGYAESSINGYVRSLELFEQWSKKHSNLTENQLAFRYLKHIKKKSSKIATINGAIQPIRIYYKLFRKNNPFEHFILNRTTERIKRSNFSKEELEEIYDNYPQTTLQQIRDKVLLGLYVFQAIKSTEVRELNINDIDLETYQIHLKGNRRTNGRRLKLDVKQVILLNNYINNERKQMLNGKTKDILIVTTKEKNCLQSVIESLAKKIRKTTYGFLNFNDVRACVIQHWVKEYDLRKAQYLAGHRYISSTEKFITEDISKLQSELNKYFPL